MSTDPREYLEMRKIEVFEKHDVIAEFGELTLTRLEGRLWLFLTLTPIFTANDTDLGQIRMSERIEELRGHLFSAAAELRRM
jgi:hypothetical protein